MSRKYQKKMIPFIISIIVIFILTGCKSFNKEPIVRTAFQLDTIITITIYDKKDEKLLDECMNIMKRYEQLFSRTDKNSEIYKLNQGQLADSSGNSEVSSETAEIITAGIKYGEISNGVFDIAIAPLTSIWDFSSEDPQIPDPLLIQDAVNHVNYHNIKVDQDQVRFLQEDMGIDLGAIAKGYIADKLKEYLEDQGVKSATINLGGNVLCIGGKPDGSPFKIGIQKPFADRNETIASMDIRDLSVVSSGIYERCFTKNGVLYHHLLNPKTGYPFDNKLLSVTIVSPKSVDGDALSTTCFSLGLEEGMKLLNSIPDVYGFFVTEDYEYLYSDGFEEKFHVNTN